MVKKYLKKLLFVLLSLNDNSSDIIVIGLPNLSTACFSIYIVSEKEGDVFLWLLDIIILNGHREIYLGVFVNLFFRIKTVTIRHTEFLFGKTLRELIRDYLFKLSALFSDQVICVSKNVFNQLEGRGLKNILFISNWANQIYSKAKWVPLNNGYFHILVVSRLDKMKGHLDVFHACAGLNKV